LHFATVRHIPVVPVRMTEAWLLADEAAIRLAAGNPHGQEDLHLPDIRKIEDLVDPKRVLHDVLTTASGLNARRRSRFPAQRRVHLIPNYIDDYSRLDALPAFQKPTAGYPEVWSITSDRTGCRQACQRIPQRGSYLEAALRRGSPHSPFRRSGPCGWCGPRGRKTGTSTWVTKTSLWKRRATSDGTPSRRTA